MYYDGVIEGGRRVNFSITNLTCMNKVNVLIAEVAISRNNYLSIIDKLTQSQASYKVSENEWSIIEITEHLFWAEQGGIFGMWKTLHAIREGKMERTFDSVHKDLPIQQIIDLTWQPKEQVPAVAAPRLGGTLVFWQYSFAKFASGT